MSVLQDLRFALRAMWKGVGFTLAVVLSFALGIAVTAVGYNIIEKLWMVQLPYPDSNRLVVVERSYPAREREQSTADSERRNLEDWSVRSQCFQFLAARGLAMLPFRAGGQAKSVTVEQVSHSFFGVLAVKPLLGRVFRPEEGTKGRDDVVVLSYRLWTREFAARPDVLGAGIWLGGRRRRIVGVMPAGFRDSIRENRPSLWIPLSSSVGMSMIGRLKPGAGLAQAQAEAETLGYWSSGVRVKVTEMRAGAGAGLPSSFFWTLIGLVGVVFAVACTNVAGLLLARGNRRFKELSLRTALGASRTRLVRQLLTESVLMSMIGCVAGVWLARVGSALLNLAWPDTLPQFSVNWRVLAASALAAAAAAIVSSLGPALAASQGGPSLQRLDGHHASPARRRRSFSRWLVGAEVALSLILLTIPGLFLKLQADALPTPSFRTEELLLMHVWPWKQEVLAQREKWAPFFTETLNAVRGGPGIRHAALASGFSLAFPTLQVEIHRAGQSLARHASVSLYAVSPEYLETMSLPLLAGRFFTQQDGPASEKVVVISQALARNYWGGRSPLGDTLAINGERQTIVGVAADSRRFQPGLKPNYEVLAPYLQRYNPVMFVVMRTQGPSGTFRAVPAKLIAAIDPDQPVEVWTAGERIKQETSQLVAIIGLFGIFAAGALLLSGIGIHAVASYSASERTREIGIRMALGGRKGRVVWEVMREGVLTVLLGIIVGFWAAVFGSIGLLRLIRAMEVSAGLAWLWALQVGAGIAVLAVLTALSAYYGPTKRAAAAEPADILRCE